LKYLHPLLCRLPAFEIEYPEPLLAEELSRFGDCLPAGALYRDPPPQ